MDLLKFWNCSLLSFRVCNPCYQCVLQHGEMLVVESVTYCKKYCLIKKNKDYWSIYKFIFNSPIGFRYSFNNVEATSKQCWCNVVSTLYNVVWTLFQCRGPTLYQSWKTEVGFCFIFNVGSTLFQRYFNVDPQGWDNGDSTLKCWLGRRKIEQTNKKIEIRKQRYKKIGIIFTEHRKKQCTTKHFTCFEKL